MRHRKALPWNLSLTLSLCSIAAAGGDQKRENKDSGEMDPAKAATAAQPGGKASSPIVETVCDYKVVDGRSLKAYVCIPVD
jgi:hypothetical protein